LKIFDTLLGDFTKTAFAAAQVDLVDYHRAKLYGMWKKKRKSVGACLMQHAGGDPGPSPQDEIFDGSIQISIKYSHHAERYCLPLVTKARVYAYFELQLIKMP
jgi:hypothetical protein